MKFRENKSSPIIVFSLLSLGLISFVFYFILGGNLPDFTKLSDGWKSFAIMYTPALAAYITSKIFKDEFLTKNEIFGSLNRWHIFSLLLPFFLMIITAIVSLVLFPKTLSFNSHFTGGVEFNEDIPFLLKSRLLEQIEANPGSSLFIYIVQSLTQAWSGATLWALGEELGWRGYLLKKTDHLGFWPSVFIIGPIWGLWHFPLILKGYNYPTNPVLGVPMMMLACTALTPLMIYVTKKSKSVWASAIFHGSFNSFTLLAFIPLHGEATTFTVGVLGLSGIIAALTLFFIVKKSNETINTILDSNQSCLQSLS
jgi:membrane protease YdiL (CAAX protease family)